MDWIGWVSADSDAGELEARQTTNVTRLLALALSLSGPPAARSDSESVGDDGSFALLACLCAFGSAAACGRGQSGQCLSGIDRKQPNRVLWWEWEAAAGPRSLSSIHTRTTRMIVSKPASSRVDIASLSHPSSTPLTPPLSIDTGTHPQASKQWQQHEAAAAGSFVTSHSSAGGGCLETTGPSCSLRSPRHRRRQRQEQAAAAAAAVGACWGCGGGSGQGNCR